MTAGTAADWGRGGGDAHLIRGKLVVQVEEIKRWRRRLAQRWREDSGLKRRERMFELGRDERKRLVLDVELRVQGNRLWYEGGVKLEERVVKEGREILGDFLRLLQAAENALGERLGIRQLVVLGDVRIFRVVRIHNHVSAREPAHKHIEQLCVLVLVHPIIMKHARRAEQAHPAGRAGAAGFERHALGLWWVS